MRYLLLPAALGLLIGVGRRRTLGISLAHGSIAQGHGGTFSGESRPGWGSAFLISLPLA